MNKRIHRHLADTCVQTLEEIRAGAAADRAVGRALGAHPKWGARDRAFFADTVYECVRWHRRLAHLAETEEAWTLAGMHWALRGYDRPDWAAWPDISPAAIQERQATLAAAPRALRESLSDELDELGSSALGAQWELELRALNQAAPVFLRINPAVTSLDAVTRQLADNGIVVKAVPGAPLALRVESGRVPPRLTQSGAFEIQDAGSQQVAPFMQVEPSHIVLDLCAGAGGKTLHLAALMQHRGELHAFDTEPAKLSTLRTRASRAGVRVRTHDAAPDVLSRFHGEADRVLADAPCTGTGTLRRHAELKYRITPATLAATLTLQRQILSRAARLVRAGGKLTYATCSLLPAENGDQAAWFTAEHSDFEWEEQRYISPAATGWDGFFMARWRRKAASRTKSRNP